MPVSTRVGYTREEVDRLLYYAHTSWSWIAQRDYAIVLFLLGTGVRAGGILGLTVDDVTSSDYLQNRRLRVVEKGSKERWVPVGRKSAHAIAEVPGGASQGP